MVKKILIAFLCLTIAVVGLGVGYWCFQAFTNIMKPSNIDKMVICNGLVGNISFTTTDRDVIKDIANRINSLKHTRNIKILIFTSITSSKCLPDISVRTYSENGDKIGEFYLYGMIENGVHYCSFEKNEKSFGRYLIDGEELYELLKSYIPTDKEE